MPYAVEVACELIYNSEFNDHPDYYGGNKAGFSPAVAIKREIIKAGKKTLRYGLKNGKKNRVMILL
jgi:hypothetical protein